MIHESQRNDLFRFLNARTPMKPADEERELFFVQLIHDRHPEQKIRQRIETTELLYPDLVAFEGTPDQLLRSLRRVDAYRAGTSFLANPEDYRTRYPALSHFIDWLDVNADTATFDAVSEQVSALFRSQRLCEGRDDHDPDDDLLTMQVIVWDNLFANLFRTSDALLVTLACKYLGTLHLIEVMRRRERTEGTPGVIYRSRPLLPKWFVKLTTRADDKADAGVNDQLPAPGKTTSGEVAARFQELANASAALKGLAEKRKGAAHDVQETQNRTTAAAETLSVRSDGPAIAKRQAATTILPNFMQVSRAELEEHDASLSAIAKNLLGDTESYDLNQLVMAAQQEAATLGAQLGKSDQARAIRVGNAVLDSKDFCAEMIDHDPCGRAPRKEFASYGSNVSSSLIGDLLVTKQQLVKYDLGEVAHIENAMEGLTKERTHRRLLRSEESSLTETETTTEDERETQTTDRFDMEKATSQVLSQDFKVDSGVSVSGSYGAMQFSSTLDASYGYSSQQSQSDATSFSKSVTSRALTRVKNRVRTLKTWTLINEVEETSVHRLTNNTGDHINGVYRWVDKYYLNKIINYGKRLLFEFAVPEPAQFYLFRQLATPTAENSVLKPDDPRDVVDPTGHMLRSPADLSEINYTFWAARYGAASVDAPPPPFIRFSRAWKNEYATTQGGDIYDAWSKDLELPKDYEAVTAQVSCSNYWWGSSNISGTLATSGFGGGYSVINLPNLTESIGVSLLSLGMNWHLNVVLTLQRSAKLFSQWQINTYGKILDGYRAQKRDYELWLESQPNGSSPAFGNNPGINREIEREELKKRCLELFTGQRFESFDAAVNGIYNASSYPEILFAESIREGNLVKFFEQAFDWANTTYVFYPYFWGRKSNWLSMKRLEDPSDPLFTKFLQAGFARVVVPARPGFENFLMMFHLISGFISALGCSWNFQPTIFGALGISNTFSPGINDPVYISIAQELQSAAGYTDETGPIYGIPYVQKVPTNLVYIAQNAHVPASSWPGLPDNSAEPDIAPYL